MPQDLLETRELKDLLDSVEGMDRKALEATLESKGREGFLVHQTLFNSRVLKVTEVCLVMQGRREILD